MSLEQRFEVGGAGGVFRVIRPAGHHRHLVRIEFAEPGRGRRRDHEAGCEQRLCRGLRRSRQHLYAGAGALHKSSTREVRGSHLARRIADRDAFHGKTVDLGAEDGTRQALGEEPRLVELGDIDDLAGTAGQRIGADRERAEDVDDDDCVFQSLTARPAPVAWAAR